MRKWAWVMFPFWFFAGSTACFEEGYPGGDGPVESDVGFQLLFDEASGNFVDEVAGATLAPTGSVTYGVNFGGKYAHLSPGVTVNSGWISTGVPVAGLAAGLGPFTYEFWVQAASGSYLVMDCDRTFGAGPKIDLSPTQLIVRLGNIDGMGYETYTYNWPSSPFGSNPFKVSLRSDRDTMEAYLNETLISSKDVTGVSEEDLHAFECFMGNAGLTMLEFRFSKNATNNSTPVWYP